MLIVLKGAYSGFDYRATWTRGAQDVVVWEGTVYRGGAIIGGPSGTLEGPHDDAAAERAIRQAIEGAIAAARFGRR